MPKPSSLHLPSIGQLVLSGLGMMSSLTAAGALPLMGLIALAEGRFASKDVFPFFSLAWMAVVISLLLFPSLACALITLLGKSPPPWKLPGSLRLTSLLMVLWPLLLVIGDRLSVVSSSLYWIFFPPIQVLVLCIPLWWLVETGRRDLTCGNPQRNWGVVSFGLLITPTLIITVEIIALAIMGVVLLLWASSQPNLLEELHRVSQRLMNAQMNPSVIERIIRPYLQRPAVISMTLVIGAGLVPLIEELLKPLALWVLVRSRPSPSEGFVTGLLCGSVFALIESMGMLSTPTGSAWSGMVIGRLGTGLLHTVTTALVGWGLAVAWSMGKYLKLGTIFMISVALHGIWNTFGIFLGLAPFFASSNNFYNLGQIAPLALAVLAIFMFLILVGSNQRLRVVNEAAK